MADLLRRIAATFRQPKRASASDATPNERARQLLAEGRAALDRGARDTGLTYLAAATQLDPEILCEPWHLLPHLDAEGQGIYRDRMQARLQSWYRAPRSHIHKGVATLTHKPEMRRWIKELGLPLPRLYTGPVDLVDIDWSTLPNDIVVKPENGANSDGVAVIREGRDWMSGQPVGADPGAYLDRLYQDMFSTPPKVLVEECLVDADVARDAALKIPRDFKVFTVAGHVGFTRVHDRNAPDGKRSLASFSRTGARLPPCLHGWPEAPPELSVPDGYDAMIAMAQTISQKLPWLLRLDFYLTPDGPVFGEFTTFPNAGLDSTPFSRRTLLQMWELWPD